MNSAEIFALIEKGLTLLPLLIQAGVDISTHIQQLIDLSKAGQTGGISDDDLAKIRASFDAALDDFNSPMDP